MITRRHWMLASLGLSIAQCWGQTRGSVYDPLQTDAPAPRTLRLEIADPTRQREIPILVYLPTESTRATSPAPLLLFSHGLGGDRDGSAYLGLHWARRGYVAVFLQHPGSDRAVWESVPVSQRMRAMQREANARNLMLRAGDVKAVLDMLERWQAERAHPLAGRMDLGHVGMSGHSFGAVTTQAVSGQQPFSPRLSFLDQRIRAAISMSPSSPARGTPAQAFGRVAIPWLLMTGTRDVAIIGGTTLESRLAVFPALPPGGKYELVLWEAEHSAFTERPLPGDKVARNPNHHRAILAVSTAFWDAWLRGLPEARAWLDGDGPRAVLEVKDRWQHK